MDIKLLALDMDGTTYKWGGEIIDKNIEPIQQALKIGVEVVIVTGRPAISPYNKFIENGFGNYGKSIVVAYNGGCIYDFKDNKVVEANTIDSKQAKKIFDLTQLEQFKDVEVWGYVDDLKTVVDTRIKNNDEEYKIDKSFFDGKCLSYKQVKDKWNYSFFKIMVANMNEEFINELKQLDLELIIGTHAIEINAKGINKAYAIKWLCKKQNISSNNVMAIGDGSNDVPMIKYAGYGVSLANSIDKVKQVADIHIDLTNEQGGVAKAINQYILNK